MTDRELLGKIWNETWGSSTWYPAWTKTFADLTPHQAAWKPAPGRNSIWQNLNHIAFWREVTVKRLAGAALPPEDEINRRNFEEPADTSDAAWRDSLARFERSHQLIRDAITNESNPVEKLQYLPSHDAYHMGQVMYLRALQGLPAVGYG